MERRPHCEIRRGVGGESASRLGYLGVTSMHGGVLTRRYLPTENHDDVMSSNDVSGLIHCNIFPRRITPGRLYFDARGIPWRKREPSKCPNRVARRIDARGKET